MAEIVEIERFLELKRNGMPVIDVRSPGEYAHAHIPGAVSLPLFDDVERAEVGTIYKRQGKRFAVQRGLEFVGPKMRHFTDIALSLDSEELLVHCWRGGMRSASMAWLFETVGLRCRILKDGYKAYRNHVLGSFARPYDFRVLGGCTGVGKTDLLKELRKIGGQVLDLEGLANHKGSAFGSLGENEQPSVEMFENNICEVLDGFDLSKQVFVEDESRNVGKMVIPQDLWTGMRSSRMIVVEAERKLRMERIMRDYAGFPVELIAPNILKIEKRMGREKCRAAYGFCIGGDVRGAAEICLDYYDKMYLSQLERRKKECEYSIVEAFGMDMKPVAEKLIGEKNQESCVCLH